MVHGAVATPFPARQVAESAIPLTVTAPEVRALISATSPGGKNALISMFRNRRRVTPTPVLFTNRRHIVSVPFAALDCTAARSLTRFGAAAAATVESISSAGNNELRSVGLARF
jgi:hypothetical protein